MCHTTVVNIAVHNWKRTPSVTNQSPRRMKMECAFMLCTIHLPRSGGATSPGQMQRTVTRSFGLLVWPEVSSPDIADSASPPRFHPRYCLARKPRKSPSTLSAFAMFDQVSSGGAPATNRHNPYSINPGLLDPRRRGLNGCCMSGEFLLLVVNPAPQPLPKTPVVINLPWPAGRGCCAFLFECEWLWRSLGQYLPGKLCHLHK